MATLSGGGRLAAALGALARKYATQRVVKVGFLAGSTYPDGTSVPLVAAVQEFGSPARNIPPRPYFRTMVKKEQGHWGADIAKLIKANDVPTTLGLMGELVAGELRDSIIAMNAPPLAPATIARKGSAKVLIDTGHMLNSIDYEIS